MINHLLKCLLYGVVSGFSEFTPVSASAHHYFFSVLLNFDGAWPLLRFFVHCGALASVAFLYRQRLRHTWDELRLAALPVEQRKRPPDVETLINTRLLATAVPPVLLGAICSAFLFRNGANLLWTGILLIACATLTYVPEYIPGGDRKTGMMTPFEGLVLGMCAGLAVIPGISGMGLMLAFGLLRKCDRQHILDNLMLIVAAMLAAMIVVDIFCVIISGLAGFTVLRFLGCIFAAAASFGGSVGAILMMRFLAVKIGYTGFAFYNWGLGIFSFILYLMV